VRPRPATICRRSRIVTGHYLPPRFDAYNAHRNLGCNYRGKWDNFFAASFS
jgi:hypothetical protein